MFQIYHIKLADFWRYTFIYIYIYYIHFLSLLHNIIKDLILRENGENILLYFLENGENNLVENVLLATSNANIFPIVHLF